MLAHSDLEGVDVGVASLAPVICPDNRILPDLGVPLIILVFRYLKFFFGFEGGEEDIQIPIPVGPRMRRMRMPDMMPNPWATYVPTLYQATSRTTSALADAP